MILGAFRGGISPVRYPFAALALLLVPHAAVALAFWAASVPLRPDLTFWFLPLRHGTDLLGDSVATAITFAATILATWPLAALSFRRAGLSTFGFGLALLTIVPGVQIGAAAILALLPVRRLDPDFAANPAASAEDGADAAGAYMLQGVLAGVGIIVFAMLASALTFGAYGWGLFVMTPIVVGMTTAYLANRGRLLSVGETTSLVMGAGLLGAFALLMLALEGLACILLIAPLTFLFSFLGGLGGRAMASARNRLDRPLMAVAILPAVFAIEAAVPPAAPIATDRSIVIAAPRDAVWTALTGDGPIEIPPGLVESAGLAYPISGRILGRGVDGERIGYFSTGTARERITAWEPGRRLAFTILDQPPAMEEMSPWRKVHAPHVEGYFETDQTSFELEPLAGGGTRLTVRASHVLRLDPVPYWEPLARWTLRQNSGRVLRDIKAKAEAMRRESPQAASSLSSPRRSG